MKANKEGLLRKALATGKYRVDCINGLVYFYHKATNNWRIKKANTLKSGYKQHILFLGRGNGRGFTIYESHIVWLADGNSIPKGFEIDHDDHNPSNNRIDNLRCITKTKNLSKRTPRVIDKNKQYDKIRDKEIQAIYKLWLTGESQRQIALITGINRITVRYHIKKMEKKEQFKYSELFSTE